MLVRSGLRCHCCFKLKHECEHRKAAILLANYRTFSCKSPLSLGLLLGFLFCPGSPGPGPCWLNLEPPYSRHSILATPGIFGHGYTCVRCEAGTGKVVSTPGGSPAPPRLLSVRLDSLSMAETSRHHRSNSTTGLHLVSWSLMSAHTPSNHLLPLPTPSKHHVRESRFLTQGRIFKLSHAKGRSGHGGAKVAGRPAAYILGVQAPEAEATNGREDHKDQEAETTP